MPFSLVACFVKIDSFLNSRFTFYSSFRIIAKIEEKVWELFMNPYPTLE